MARRASQTLNDKAQATRLQILEAAEAEFAEHSLSSARLEAIATRAGVTKTLIFYYFGTKERLREAVLSRALEPSMTLLTELESSGKPIGQRLAEFCDRFSSFIKQHTHYHRILSEAMLVLPEGASRAQDQFINQLTQLLVKGISQGTFHPFPARPMAEQIINL
jgi:AcrR family transcriptional regulator